MGENSHGSTMFKACKCCRSCWVSERVCLSLLKGDRVLGGDQAAVWLIPRNQWSRNTNMTAAGQSLVFDFVPTRVRFLSSHIEN